MYPAPTLAEMSLDFRQYQSNLQYFMPQVIEEQKFMHQVIEECLQIPKNSNLQ
jgi:hypothetical protein